MRGKGIQSVAGDLFEDRTDTTKSFSRDWMHDFRERHKDSIAKVIDDGLETDRSQISDKEVNLQISDIEELMNDPTLPHLLINFDETGFEKRPDKCKRKKV